MVDFLRYTLNDKDNTSFVHTGLVNNINIIHSVSKKTYPWLSRLTTFGIITVVIHPEIHFYERYRKYCFKVKDNFFDTLRMIEILLLSVILEIWSTIRRWINFLIKESLFFIVAVILNNYTNLDPNFF